MGHSLIVVVVSLLNNGLQYTGFLTLKHGSFNHVIVVAKNVLENMFLFFFIIDGHSGCQGPLTCFVMSTKALVHCATVNAGNKDGDLKYAEGLKTQLQRMR